MLVVATGIDFDILLRGRLSSIGLFDGNEDGNEFGWERWVIFGIGVAGSQVVGIDLSSIVASSSMIKEDPFFVVFSITTVDTTKQLLCS